MEGKQAAVANTGVVIVAQPSEADAMPSTSATATRLGYVDSLRALAALHVMLCHFAWEIWPDMNLIPRGFVGTLITLMMDGHLAVSVFIVLSGFSLMLPVARNNYRLPWGALGFYRRRARRILPPYYLAMALSLLLIWLFIGQKTGTNWDVSLPVTGASIVTHLLLLQNLSATDHATINYVFWSIAMECQIYAFFPLLILGWRRYPPWLASLLVMSLSTALLFGLAPTWIGHLPYYSNITFVPQYFGLFGMGMFAASVHVKPTPFWSSIRDSGRFDALAVVCLLLLAPMILVNAPILFADIVVGLATVSMLLASARHRGANPIRAILQWRPLVWLGGISYSIYLIHMPLIQVVWQYGLHPLRLSAMATYVALLVVGPPLIVAAAWAFWWWCERPFLNTAPAAKQNLSK